MKWFKLILVLLLLSPVAHANVGPKSLVKTLAAAAEPLCAGSVLARYAVIDNRGAASMVIGVDNTIAVATPANGGFILSAGETLKLDLLKPGELYDLCKIFAGGTATQVLTVTYF